MRYGVKEETGVEGSGAFMETYGIDLGAGTRVAMETLTFSPGSSAVSLQAWMAPTQSPFLQLNLSTLDGYYLRR